MGRREVAVWALAALLVAGCGDGRNDTATSGARVDPSAVVVGHAGSLNALVQDKLTPAMAAQGIAIHSDPAASLAAAQKIKDGIPTDHYATADANTNQVLMGAANGDKVRWFATFASNAIVIAYSPGSPLLQDLEKAKAGKSAWYAPLEKKGVRVARRDPDADPAGYYTVMVTQLAELDANDNGLKKRILGDDRDPDQIRATGVPDMLNSGDLDAAFMYRTSALSAGLPFIELPTRVNLSNPEQNKSYARATFTNRAGITFTGAAIEYSIAPVEGAAHAEEALRVLEFLLSDAGQKLVQSLGFLHIPMLIGGDRSAVPAALGRYVEGPFAPAP